MGFQVLEVVHPVQDDPGRHEVGRGPVHHGFVADGQHLDDVWVGLGQGHRPANLCLVGFEVLLGMVGGACPRALAIYPNPKHHVHLEAWLLLLQVRDGLDHVGGVGQLDVVRAQEPNAHGMQNAHVFFQLVEGGLLRTAGPPVPTIRDGEIVGVAQKFSGRKVFHGVGWVGVSARSEGRGQTQQDDQESSCPRQSVTCGSQQGQHAHGPAVKP